MTNTSMNHIELLALLDELRALPVETEWLEFKEAKTQYDFDKLGRYFSAISNEANLKGRDYGWLIFGVEDKDRRVVGSQFRKNVADLENLKKEVAVHTDQQLSFLDIFVLSHTEVRVVMFQIPAAPRGIPIGWKGHYYGRDGESLGALNIQEIEQIRRQSVPDDWSAMMVPEADLNSLDSTALALARDKYREKHPELAEEMSQWDEWRFLHKLKIAREHQLTRAAILLLGKPEASQLISNSNLQISWIVQDADGLAKDYHHFGLPLLLSSDGVFGKIRNLTYRHMGDDSLFPMELPQYDNWVIREALHNCIAHQDYGLGGKVNVVEKTDELIFSNLGEFIPKSVEAVIEKDVPPEHYRNPLLASAMVELKMMDTIGSGIKRMFVTQRKRFFPLPDYVIDKANRRVEVHIFGRILDEKYSRVLRDCGDLSLADVMLLDAVQKGRAVPAEAIKHLRKLKLIEGRAPKNLYVSSKIASAMGEQVAYTKNRCLDKEAYKMLILKHLDKFGSATREDINQLLLDKLPEVLSNEQKEHRIKNILSEMRSRDKTIINQGSKRKPAWVRV